MTESTGAAPGMNEQFTVIHIEIRRIAGAMVRGSRENTLNPTALVNAAYIKLASSDEFSSVSPLHLKRTIARVMRQVLVDHNRRKRSLKRGDGAMPVTLDDQVEQKAWSTEDLVILGDLIEKLRAQKPRLADVVECRFYLGMTDEEIAKELGVSRVTVERDWKTARAWLNGQLG